ncbi:MAG: hypothetical protein L3J16_07770 [Anaerolineales bacterium]|nr:hypothetical protein [Anaerolineales bacterium]
MTEPERAALEHIRRVAESVINTGEFSPTPTETPPAESPPEPPLTASGEIALLKVPYISQFGPGADQYQYDSAAAAGAMLVQAYTSQTVTPNAFFTKAGQSLDKPLSMNLISTTLARYGIPNRQRSRMRILDISAALASGRPVLLPLRHSLLREAGLTNETTSAPHYMLAVGLDMEHIYLHDPLWQDGGGAGLAVPILLLYQAWNEVGRVVSAYERTGLIPNHPLRRFVSANTVINIRSGPGTTYTVVGQTKSGELYEASQIIGDWGQIGADRWIALRYTRDI